MDLLDDEGEHVEGGAFGYQDSSSVKGKGSKHDKKMLMLCCFLNLVLLLVLVYLTYMTFKTLRGEGLTGGVVPIYDTKLQFAAGRSEVGSKSREEQWGVNQERFIVDTPIMSNKVDSATLAHQLMSGN